MTAIARGCAVLPMTSTFPVKSKPGKGAGAVRFGERDDLAITPLAVDPMMPTQCSGMLSTVNTELSSGAP